ncbi:MAG: response regulator [Lachnospiraceae bacterium]|nr:response regulator [Lachnospiraceae bacterium]
MEKERETLETSFTGQDRRPEKAEIAAFISGLSHDLRVPMNAITGYVMLLMKNAQDPERVAEYAHKISLSCQDVLTVVDQAVDVATPAEEIPAPEQEEFAMVDFLAEVGRAIQPFMEMHGVQYTLETSGLEHDVFRGDRRSIGRILHNLLSGAARNTQEGGVVTLRVSGRPGQDGRSTFLTFEIEDTSEGMSPEVLKRMLSSTDPARAAAQDRNAMQNFSMNLAATRRLVERAGGTISVQSTPGIGTTVSVGLRLEDVHTIEDDFWIRKGIRKALFAGANMEEGARISALLGRAGVQTEYVSCGTNMLQMVRSAHMEGMPYDLVLLDENLQDMTGIEALSQVRALTWADIGKVILMHTPDRVPHEEESSGAAIMPRPFYLSMLRGLLEELAPQNEAAFDLTPAEKVLPETESPLQGLHILVAEDNAMNAGIAKELLEMEGARCEIAGNGMAAVAMFRNSRPAYYDIILMDIQMPVMNGYAATQKIRSLERADAATVPILAMTASILSEDVRRAFDCGMNAHVAKPIDIRLLTSTIRKLRSQRTA